MAIYTYEKDYRDLEGKVSSASNTKKNIESIQDEINDLSWDNVERGSLDQYHAKPGEPFKEIEGRYSNKTNFGGSFPQFSNVGSLSFQVDKDCGVYLVGTVSMDTTPLTSARNADRSRYEIRLSARDDNTGNQIGSWNLSKGYAVDSNGGLKIVWGYQPKDSGTNTVLMHISRHSGESISPSNVGYVNLTAFVIKR
tara:strand:+ start:6930 stop:7517 length:588 start_codon:yes stop_codon:yes gene_type:complete